MKLIKSVKCFLQVSLIAGDSLVECSQTRLNMVASGESQELTVGYEDRDNDIDEIIYSTSPKRDHRQCIYKLAHGSN